MRVLAALALGLSILQAQESPVLPDPSRPEVGFDLGPLPTRNMFTLLQAPMTYQPQSPVLVGRGHWRVSLQVVRANVFEFSDAIKDDPPPGFSDRLRVDRATVEAWATRYKADPFIFYFDEEMTRTTLQVRTGIGPRTDLWVELPVEAHSGGVLDGPIEAFHSALGFSQWGRDLVAKNQAVVATIRYGQVTFYDQGSSRPKLQDPLIGIVHQISNHGTSGLALTATVKPGLTKAYGVFQSGWDWEGGLSGWFKRGRSTFYYGAAYTHRGRGNTGYNRLDYTNDLGAHFTWQGFNDRKVQPFLQLYYLSGFSTPQPFAKLNGYSLQHDLGFHWFITPKAALTFRYVNNISHNENTDDASFGVGLTVKL